MKKSWIPRSQFFSMLKAGTLPPDLQEKYANRKPRAKKSRKTRRTSKNKTKKNNFTKSPKNPRKLRTFTVYVGGVEQSDKIESFSNYQAEKIAQKMYHTKNILLSED